MFPSSGEAMIGVSMVVRMPPRALYVRNRPK
jgi:hypothetical protein